MIFLVEYDRRRGRITRFKKLDDSQRVDAQKLRLEIELDLNRRGQVHEVVLLEAETEAALRRTHRRYFEDAEQISTVAGRDSAAKG